MFTFVLFLGCSILNASSTELMYDKSQNNDVAHRNVRFYADADKNNVCITSDTLIYDATITIKDQYGCVMYKGVTTLMPHQNILYVPDDEVGNKYYIELSYDEIRLFGYFEEQ